MKKEERESAFPTLYSNWKRDKGLSSTQPHELYFSDFFLWVEQNHREYTSSTSAKGDFEMWFDRETKQTWRN